MATLRTTARTREFRARWLTLAATSSFACADLFSDLPPKGEILVEVSEDQRYYVYVTDGGPGGPGGLPLTDLHARIAGDGDVPLAPAIGFARIIGGTATWSSEYERFVWWPGLDAPLPVGPYPSLSASGAISYWDARLRAVLFLSPNRCPAGSCQPSHLLNDVDYVVPQLSADGQWAVVEARTSTPSDSVQLSIINTVTGRRLFQFENAVGIAAGEISFAPDGGSIIFIGRREDRPHLRVYNLSSERMTEGPEFPPGWITAHAYLDDGRASVIFAPRDEAGFLWATVNQGRIEEHRRFSGAAKLEFFAAGRLLIESAYDTEFRPLARVFDPRRPDAPPTVLDNFGAIGDITPDGRRLAYFQAPFLSLASAAISTVSLPDGGQELIRAPAPQNGEAPALLESPTLYGAETLVYRKRGTRFGELHVYRQEEDQVIASDVVTFAVARDPGRIYYTVGGRESEVTSAVFGRIETYDLPD